MLRKRTCFKPNTSQIKQAAQLASNQKHEAKESDPKSSSSPNPAEPSTPGDETHQRKPPELLSTSAKAVQDAIAQLTGQKVEPIKSITALRGSANKNVQLKELIFSNPPMSKEQKRHKKLLGQRAKTIKERENKSREDSTHSEVVSEQSLIPKVKMGPEGKLVLDESSTIINRKNHIKSQAAIIEDNEDIISRTNYDSFRRKPSATSQTKWSPEDTKKFYQALAILGTDFSMMESLIFSGHRSRTELHKKFKREERVNKVKIDITLSNRVAVNSEEFEGIKELLS